MTTRRLIFCVLLKQNDKNEPMYRSIVEHSPDRSEQEGGAVLQRDPGKKRNPGIRFQHCDPGGCGAGRAPRCRKREALLLWARSTDQSGQARPGRQRCFCSCSFQAAEAALHRGYRGKASAYLSRRASVSIGPKIAVVDGSRIYLDPHCGLNVRT